MVSTFVLRRLVARLRTDWVLVYQSWQNNKQNGTGDAPVWSDVLKIICMLTSERAVYGSFEFHCCSCLTDQSRCTRLISLSLSRLLDHSNAHKTQKYANKSSSSYTIRTKLKPDMNLNETANPQPKQKREPNPIPCFNTWVNTESECVGWGRKSWYVRSQKHHRGGGMNCSFAWYLFRYRHWTLQWKKIVMIELF